MEKLIQSILDVYSLSPIDLELLIRSGEEIHVAKGESIIKEGEICRSVFIIKEGIWRAYHMEEGREITIWFVAPGELAFSSWGYIDDQPSGLTLEASCDSIALRYSKECFEDLFTTSMDLAVWQKKMLERMVLNTDQSLIDIYKPGATERYKALVEKMPYILQNVPLKDIAGYLGITPQSLSRIRAQLVRKK